LIVLIVLSMTAVVFAISIVLPKTYETSARIVMDDRPGGLEPADSETVRRRLATVRALITTREVRAQAAARLDGESADTLKDKITATVDRDANIVDVHATDNDPVGAAAIANTIARVFVSKERAAEQVRLARARAELRQALGRVSSPRSAEAQALRERLSELSVSAASADSDLVLAEPAQPPAAPSSPRPIRNTIFAFFASVFLAVLAALGLGQLAPRVSGARDLSVLTGTPIMGVVPRGRRGRDASLEAEAYQELQTALAMHLPSASKIVVVAGALPAEETSVVVAGLARVLAQSGRRTLVLSADLRRPRVHEVLGLPRSPGLVEVLESGRQGSMSLADFEETAHTLRVEDGELEVVTAGRPVKNAAGLLVGESFSDLLLELECSEYGHVVIEAPALLGSAHGQLVARHADTLLVVCDPERLSPAEAVELGEVLQRLDPPVAGLVTLGSRSAAPQAAAVTLRREPSRVDV
jgi:capsular polysaccharide biosynthesis protein/MinD-like ATPase involved in chromosome partitioning or flagellar assembly